MPHKNRSAYWILWKRSTRMARRSVWTKFSSNYNCLYIQLVSGAFNVIFVLIWEWNFISIDAMEEETSTWGLGCSLMVVGRPIFAVLLVITLILLGWVAAWKLVLVHVPLVQEVFGLRKKPSAEARPKHVTSGRFSHLYDSNRSKSKSSSRWRSNKTCFVSFVGRHLIFF